MPYPFIRFIPMLSKKEPNSALIGAPPVTIFIRFPPKALWIDLNNFLLK